MENSSLITLTAHVLSHCLPKYLVKPNHCVFWVGHALKYPVCVCVCVCSAVGSDLTEVTVTDAARELLDFSELLGQPFLLVQLLGESLELSERQLQRQSVLMPHRGVFQHVL